MRMEGLVVRTAVVRGGGRGDEAKDGGRI